MYKDVGTSMFPRDSIVMKWYEIKWVYQQKGDTHPQQLKSDHLCGISIGWRSAINLYKFPSGSDGCPKLGSPCLMDG